MAEGSQPPVIDEYGEGALFAECTQHPQQSEQTRDDTRTPAGDTAATDSPNSTADSGLPMSERNKRVFDENNDIVNDPLLVKVLGLPPPPKRTRWQFNFSANRAAPADLSGIPTSSATFADQSVGSSQPHQRGQAAVDPFTSAVFSQPTRDGQVAVNSLTPIAAASQARPQTAENISLEQFSAFLKGETPDAPPSPMPAQSPPNPQGDAIIPPASQAVPSRQPEQPLPPSRVRYGQRELIAFPSSREDLPAGLSLNQIAQDYPNHLRQKNLRPFIDADWTAKDVWSAMRDSAKTSAAQTRPWNKLEHRLLKEKKKMADEQAARQARSGAGQSQGSIPSTASMMGTSNGATAELVRAFAGNVRPEDTTHQPTNPTSTAPINAGSIQNKQDVGFGVLDRAEVRSDTLKALFRAELGKQKPVLSEILSYGDPQWQFRSQQDRDRRTAEEWIRRAKRLEISFAMDRGLDASDIDIGPNSIREMLYRLLTMLSKAYMTPAASAASTAFRESAMSAAENRLMACQELLGMLQGWTEQWREQLQALGHHTSEASTDSVSLSRSSSASQTIEYRTGEPSAASTMIHSSQSKVYVKAVDFDQQMQSRFDLQSHAAAQEYGSAQVYGGTQGNRDLPGYGTSPDYSGAPGYDSTQDHGDAQGYAGAQGHAGTYGYGGAQRLGGSPGYSNAPNYRPTAPSTYPQQQHNVGASHGTLSEHLHYQLTGAENQSKGFRRRDVPSSQSAQQMLRPQVADAPNVDQGHTGQEREQDPLTEQGTEVSLQALFGSDALPGFAWPDDWIGVDD